MCRFTCWRLTKFETDGIREADIHCKASDCEVESVETATNEGRKQEENSAHELQFSYPTNMHHTLRRLRDPEPGLWWTIVPTWGFHRSWRDRCRQGQQNQCQIWEMGRLRIVAPRRTNGTWDGNESESGKMSTVDPFQVLEWQSTEPVLHTIDQGRTLVAYEPDRHPRLGYDGDHERAIDLRTWSRALRATGREFQLDRICLVWTRGRLGIRDFRPW